jgi:DNA replication and repair protein RecF
LLISKLRLENFRNQNSSVFEFTKGINLFVGPNGRGKTNILEAIFILCQGKSFRPGDNKALINFSGTSAFLKAELINNRNLTKSILACSIEPQKKHFLINGKKISATLLPSQVPAVIFSPESLSVIKETSEQRRNLLDDFVNEQSSLNSQVLRNFHKVLQTRNKFLRELKLQIAISKSSYLVLESLNESFLKSAVDVTMLRIHNINLILPFLRSSIQKMFGGNVEITVDYVVSGETMGQAKHSDIFDSMRNRLIELQKSEISLGHSLVGPHKHDIKFLINGKDSRFFCSQGQQRSIILAFKIAQIVYHRTVLNRDPVLLLDDVLSELDNVRRLSLLQLVSEFNTQIFISATDVPEYFPNQKNTDSIFNFQKEGFSL